jgi:hypothetical protein
VKVQFQILAGQNTKFAISLDVMPHSLVNSKASEDRAATIFKVTHYISTFIIFMDKWGDWELLTKRTHEIRKYILLVNWSW